MKKKQTLQIALLMLASSVAGSVMTMGLTQVVAQAFAQANDPATIPYQGRLESNGSPVTANLNMRFTLSSDNNPNAGQSEALISVKNGYFSHDLQVPAALKSSNRVGVEVEVQKPNTSTYVKLQGKQWIYPALRAYKADAGNDTFNIPTQLLLTNGSGEAADITRYVSGGTVLKLNSGATGNDDRVEIGVANESKLVLRRDNTEIHNPAILNSTLTVRETATINANMSVNKDGNGQNGNLDVQGRLTVGELAFSRTTYSAHEQGANNINMIEASKGFCYLTGVHFQENDDFVDNLRCNIEIVGTRFQLQAFEYRNTGESQVWCRADCIEF